MQRYWLLSVSPTVLWCAFPTVAIINTSESELLQYSGGSNGVSEKLIHADCLSSGPVPSKLFGHLYNRHHSCDFEGKPRHRAARVIVMVYELI